MSVLFYFVIFLVPWTSKKIRSFDTYMGTWFQFAREGDIKTGRAERLGITDSPYCVLDSKVSYKMPTFNFEGNYMFFNASIDSLLLAILRLIKLNNINKKKVTKDVFM